MHDLARLCRKLNYEFRDISLLNTALTHRSAGARNNERMEFLGDSILGLAISTELYSRFARASEGELSRMRASLVKGDTLAKIAHELELGDYLNLGSGELKSGGHRRDSILADAFEAVIGAVYLDSDIVTARDFVLSFFSRRLDACSPDKAHKDPKTRLQEYLQAQGAALPEYSVLTINGKAHAQQFEVECDFAQLQQPTVGRGSSRRKAEQAAAQRALEKLDI